MINLLIYLFYTVISVFGLYFLKISNIGFNILFIIGVIFYGSGFAIWLLILKTNSLSVAFPIAASMLMIGTQVVGFYFLNEEVTFTKTLGIFIIILGVIIVYQGEVMSWTK